MATDYLQAIDAGGTVVDGGQGLAARINTRYQGADARVVETFEARVGFAAREGRTGPDATGYIIAYNAAAARNVSVNNVAYGAGFLSNNITPDQLERDRQARRSAAAVARPAAASTSAGTGNS